MTFEENMKRPENGIVFTASWDIDMKWAGARNISLFRSDVPNYVKWFTNNGIELKTGGQ